MDGVDAHRRPWLRWAMVVFALALSFRLVFIAIGPGWVLRYPDLGGDAKDYHDLAANLVTGKGYVKPWLGGGPEKGHLQPTAFRPPLWPATLAVLYRVVGPSPMAGRLLAAALDALTCALLVPLGAVLIRPVTGRLAGLLAAAYPPMWVNAASLMSEAVFTLGVVACLLAAAGFRRRQTVATASLLGAGLGLVALGRPNGFVLAVGLGGWVAATTWRRGLRQSLLLTAACVNATLLLVSPWILWTGLRLDQPAPITTNGGSVLEGEYASTMLDLHRADWAGWDFGLVIGTLIRSSNETEFDQTARHTGVAWIRRHPGGTTELVGLHVVRYFDLYWRMGDRVLTETPTRWRPFNAVAVMSSLLVSALAVGGFVRLRRQHQLDPLAPALIAWAAFAVSGVVLAAATRYRMPAEPITVLLAAAFLTHPRTGSSRTAVTRTGGPITLKSRRTKPVEVSNGDPRNARLAAPTAASVTTWPSARTKRVDGCPVTERAATIVAT